MHVSEAQQRVRAFCEARSWDRFRASLVYMHLMEELSEVGEEILYEEGYKKEGAGHVRGNPDVGRELAQSLSLLFQLAQHFGVDHEASLEAELALMEQRFPPEQWQNHK